MASMDPLPLAFVLRVLSKIAELNLSAGGSGNPPHRASIGLGTQNRGDMGEVLGL